MILLFLKKKKFLEEKWYYYFLKKKKFLEEKWYYYFLKKKFLEEKWYYYFFTAVAAAIITNFIYLFI